MATMPKGHANTEWTYTGNTSSSSSSGSKKRRSSSSSSSSSSGSGVAKTAGQQAEANMSSADQAALAAAGAAYNSATTQAEKDAAHAQAEAIRAKYGYSGGTNGAGYTATTTTTSTPAPSSGSRDRDERGSGSAPSATQTNKPETPTNPIAGATQTTVKHADGTTSTAYILNGRTVDANGNAYGFQNGDEVSTGGGTYVWNNGSATLKQNTPAASTPTTPTTPTTSGTNGTKTIAQMVAESGGKMTPEIALADPNIVTNEDGTMFYEWVTGQWYPIESMNVPTYLNGGYTLNSATGEVNDMGQQTRAYADGSGSTVVNGQNQNAQIGSVLQQLGFEEEAKPYLEAAERDRLAALEAQMAGETPVVETPVNQPVTGPEGATPTTVLRNGQEIQAWILNGRTVDANGNPFAFQNGDIVNTGGGKYIWNGNGATPVNGSTPTTTPTTPTTPSTWDAGSHSGTVGDTGHLQYFYDTTPAIENSHVDELQAQLDEIRQNMLDMNQATVDKGILDLQAQLENGLTDYDQQRAQTAINQARAASNAALRNAAMGDRGGIGQKQYSAEQNSYDQQMLAIQLEQINFQNSIDQQIAQLEAEGRFQDAQLLAEWGQYTVQTLQNEWQYYWNQRYQNSYDLDALNRQLINDSWERGQTEDNTKWNRAAQALQLGFLTPEMARELGVPEDQAQAFVDRLNLEAQINIDMAQAELDAYKNKNSGYGTSGGSSRGGGGNGYTGNYTNEYTGSNPYAGQEETAGGNPSSVMTDAEYAAFQQAAQSGGVPIYDQSGKVVGYAAYQNGQLNPGPLGSNLNYYINVGGRRLYYNPATDDWATTPQPRSQQGNVVAPGSSDAWLRNYGTLTGDTRTTDINAAKANLAQLIGRKVQQLDAAKKNMDSAYTSKVGGLERENGSYAAFKAEYDRVNAELTKLNNLMQGFPG